MATLQQIELFPVAHGDACLLQAYHLRTWEHVTASSISVLQLTHYDSDKDGVTLHFDRGQPAVHAKVLVGADGYFSKVRAQCLDDGPPQFAVISITSNHCTKYSLQSNLQAFHTSARWSCACPTRMHYKGY